MATTAERSRDEVTLQVLKRFDASIEKVIGNSGHVALYSFSTEAKAWARKDVEGSLFLVLRSTEPQYQLFIMNKKSTDNFKENVTASLAFEVQLPYLIYKNEVEEVIGIWFYAQEECNGIADLIKQVQSGLLAQMRAAPPAGHPGGRDLVQESSNLLSALQVGSQTDQKPQLLKPSFFQSATVSAPATSAAGPTGDNSFQQLLARAAMATPAAPTAACPSPTACDPNRERVRAALRRLLDNDQFLDIVAQELAAAQLL
mmetsp:Transcript_25302/g.70753  ORF Transcript_25302/g.70753 Transcript_25302/m.70753 type:complete len:258 (-) Transcript_25302:85-858(-)